MILMISKNLDLLRGMSGFLLAGALGLLALRDTIRHRAVAKQHLGYLAVFSLSCLVLYAGVYLAFPSGLVEGMPLYLILGGAALFPVLVFVFGTVGIASCTELGIPDMPLLRAAFEGKAIPDHLLGKRHAFDTARFVILAVALALVVSSLAGMQLMLVFDRQWVFPFMGADPRLAGAVVVAMSTLAGEVIARLGIQNWLARVLKLGVKRYWIAVIITAAIWAGPPFKLDAASWFTFGVRFPVGIGLGFLFRRYGFETSLAAQGAFFAIYHLLKGHAAVLKVL